MAARSSPPTHLNARAVNPEAGDHAVSADPVLREAAEAASRKSWREFPYYPKRYGERGYRFSLSDTGWITTLCEATPAVAMSQIRWLSRVLAARGMPTFLMERHLDHLHAALVEASPAESDRYAVLLRCATTLRDSRLEHLPEDRFRELAREFEVAVAGTPHRVANIGIILVSAIADEASGIENSVESLETWATDSVRFDASWVAAVRSTLAAARAAASSVARG